MSDRPNDSNRPGGGGDDDVAPAAPRVDPATLTRGSVSQPNPVSGVAPGRPGDGDPPAAAHGPAPYEPGTRGLLLMRVVVGLLVLGGLYFAFLLYVRGQPILATGFVALLGAVAYVYLAKGTYAYRYLFPGLLGFALFVLLPLVYTVYIGLTNYGRANLQTYDRVRAILMEERVQSGDTYQLDLFAATSPANAFQLSLRGPGDARFITDPFDPAQPARTLKAAPQPANATEGRTPLPIRDLVRLREAIDRVKVELPDGAILNRSGLRSYVASVPRYEPVGEGGLRDRATGETIRPDASVGSFVKEGGEKVGPGYRAFVGLANYERLFKTPGLREPLLRIFAWNVAFAFLSVAITASVGTLLANVLQWDLLRGKSVYRVLLILPYAVPAFLSILVFRGLFNPNFGEVNRLLDAAVGLRPEWFSNPWWARTMVVLVNVWLGYPYMMIVATGILQTVSAGIHEAAAIDGAGPIRKFFSLTLPSILPAMIPLLIASFAFNFNNFVLVFLLTGGRPDMAGTLTVAGQTDILVSYTYRLAFQSGADYGYASAIASVIFVVVAILAYVNLRATRVAT